jgi:hypothetical protein
LGRFSDLDINTEKPNVRPAIAEGSIKRNPMNKAKITGAPKSENIPAKAHAVDLLRSPIIKKPMPIMSPYSATAPTVKISDVMKNKKLLRISSLA